MLSQLGSVQELVWQQHQAVLQRVAGVSCVNTNVLQSLINGANACCSFQSRTVYVDSENAIPRLGI
jgi:hypothetical protein